MSSYSQKIICYKRNIIYYYDFANMILIFDDDTYVGLCGGLSYGEDSYVAINSSKPSMFEKLHLGFIIQSDYDNDQAQKKIERVKKSEEYERKEYERLKAKFNE